MKTSIVFFMSCFLFLGISLSAQNTAKNVVDQGYFPIAVWLQEPSLAQQYKDNGINMFVGLFRGLTQESLDIFRATGMKFVCSPDGFARQHKDEPLIYAWMHGDEPDNAQWNRQKQTYDPCVDPGKIIADYEKMKAFDPTRPVYLNLGRGVAVTNWGGRGECTGKTDMYKVSNDGYLKGCDIASFDVYPVNSTEKEVKNSLWYVAEGINNLEKWSNYAKPAWCWIETTLIDKNAERKPTPAEVKSQVWMAIIHGAGGIGYFCHSFHPNTVANALLRDEEMIAGVKAINQQVTQLARVINTPNTSGFAMVSSSNPAVPIDIMTKNDDGVNYLFSVAMRPGKSTAEFRVSAGEEVEVLGENRTIQIKNGIFTDTFSDYDVHLYKVK
ncbi:MAG: hypothetical protein WCY58_13300 [Mariniphaga sp.]|nr:hypothetical protein [Mariniphaga sp.]MDD4227111.1 hypothetical protein [Mariniphaga sp.]